MKEKHLHLAYFPPRTEVTAIVAERGFATSQYEVATTSFEDYDSFDLFD